MERSIGVRDLKKGAEIYEESEAIKQKRDDDFDKIRRSMDDGVFTLTGKTNVTNRKDGLGSGMRYATLGPVLMDANGTVRRDVAYDDLARHIHYAETGAPLPADADMNPPLVSQHDGMAIYLLYNGVLGDARPEGGNVLTRSVLNDLPTNGTSGPKIVYGVACRVSETAQRQHGVIFRQIPYDVRAA